MKPGAKSIIYPSPRAKKNSWTKCGELFPIPGDLPRILEALPQALAKAWPMRAKHRKALPDAIKELSRALTSQRSNLSKPYWMNPALFSAYLHYFLPWNLIRLSRLLAGLALPDPESSGGKTPVLIDAGSGPLTLPLALWIARPEWRTMPLAVLALDNCSRPMEIGMDIFANLSKTLNLPIWKTTRVSGSLESVFQHYGRLENGSHYPWLLSAANVINELGEPGRRSSHERHDAPNDSFMDLDGEDNRLHSLLNAWSGFWNYREFAGMLFVEPGTRLGGDRIMELRKLVLHWGHVPLAPCTHANPCPLSARGGGGSSSLANAWCHYVFKAGPAPAWLKEISARAGLEKQSLSLAPLWIGPSRQARPGGELTRVVSGPFSVPGLPGMARYACANFGLGLLADSGEFNPGDLIRIQKPENEDRDKRSGALILKAGPKPGNTHKNRSAKRFIKQVNNYSK